MLLSSVKREIAIKWNKFFSHQSTLRSVRKDYVPNDYIIHWMTLS